MNRRDFIQKSLAGTALALGPGLTLESFNSAPKRLTILHTNDVHSYIDPFPADHPKYPGKGGVARRAAMIEKIRREEKNVLLVDAGDIFQGTPYFNYYGGELEFKLMSLLNYDVATLGNHDFDNGIDGFYNMLPHASFEFVNANYNFDKTLLKNTIKPYKIIVKDGIKIGIFGLGVELNGLVDPKHYAQTVYLDPVAVAQEMVTELKGKNCDLILCLSHLGFEYKNEPNKISDRKLAHLTSGIDVIIGGHTHTFMDKPAYEKDKDGNDVIIHQTGCYGVNLGRIDLVFEKGKPLGNGRILSV